MLTFLKARFQRFGFETTRERILVPITLKPVKGCFFIKWMHSGFYKQAAYLESHSNENFFTERDIRELMTRSHKNGGFIATELNRPVGYTIYEQSESVLEIVNLVVHQDYRRREIGSLLLERLESRSQWDKMSAHVRESNLEAQLFLKRKGFYATNIKRKYYEDHLIGGIKYEDAYQFEKQRE